MRVVRFYLGDWGVYAACKHRGDCQVAEFLEFGADESDEDAEPKKLDRIAKDKVRMLALLQRVAEVGPPRMLRSRIRSKGRFGSFVVGEFVFSGFMTTIAR
jgi:hypothetical protein